MKRKQIKLAVGELVSVTWMDAVGRSEWLTTDEIMEMTLSQIVDVGWVIGVSDTALHMAANRDESSGRWNGIGLIPLSWIVGVERLGGVSKR